MIRRVANVVLAAPLSVLLLAAAGCPLGPGDDQNIIVIEGIVFANMIGSSPAPSTPVNPVAGAVVSTTLSARTATTDAAGHFRLDTGFDGDACSKYRVKVVAAGHPTYDKQWEGRGPHYTLFQITLSVGWPLESPSNFCKK